PLEFDCTYLTDAFLQHLLRVGQELFQVEKNTAISLCVSNAVNFTNTGLLQLLQFPNLQEVQIFDAVQMTHEARMAFYEKFPRCEIDANERRAINDDRKS